MARNSRARRVSARMADGLTGARRDAKSFYGGPILDPASGYRRKTMAHKKSRTQLSGSAVAAGALRTNV